MIEVVHLINRFGKQISFCLETDENLMVYTPAGKESAQRYALGLDPPFYPLPVTMATAKAFSISYIYVLLAATFGERPFKPCRNCTDEFECEAWEMCHKEYSGEYP